MPAAPPPVGFSTLSRPQVLAILAGMMLTLLLAAMDQTIVGTAMPKVIASLNGFDRYPWVTTAYLLTSTIAVPVFAKLSDLYGRKWFYLGGTVIFIVASWLCGAAGDMPLPLDGMNQLILSRGLQGIGGGAIMGLSSTIIGDLFPPAERGKYQGLFSAVFGMASVLGPGLGGWITDHLSWRWAFYVNAPVGVLAVLVLYLTFPYFRPPAVRRVIDWLGLAMLCAWLVPLLLALTRVSTEGWASTGVLSLLAFSLCMLPVFLLVERRAVEPLLPLGLFRIPGIAVATMAVFLLGMSIFSVFLYLPLFLQGVMGASAAESGSLLTPLMLTAIVSSIASGQLIARTGHYKWLAVLGAAATAVSMVLLTFMDLETTRAEVIRNVMLCGLGFGAIQPIFALVVQNAAPQEQLGAATASTQFFRSIGSTIGVAIFGSILLSVYHQQFARIVPVGTPAALLAPFANPLQLFELRPQLDVAFAQQPELLQKLLAGVRTSLVQALRLIFVCSATLMSAVVLLNLLLRDVPLRKK